MSSKLFHKKKKLEAPSKTTIGRENTKILLINSLGSCHQRYILPTEAIMKNPIGIEIHLQQDTTWRPIYLKPPHHISYNRPHSEEKT